MSDTQLIKEKIDVVDLVGEYVQLRPAGVNHKGLCPFHQEKSPSFMVNRERQSWHCFGCAKGGDIFTFVEEIEGMEFVEALKYLAGKAGVELTRAFEDKAQSSQKNRVKDINAEAARFFHHFLLRMDVSASAREYLADRGLSSETIEEWHIGFIPDQWDLLTKYLLKKGYSIDDLVASGLTIKRDGANEGSNRGFYDRFRGRIMFPIRDVHGSVVGFTGRVLVETEKSGGKYVNTPQTIVYDKSRVVFGLYKSKREIRKQNLIVMVEGQMDVIAAHQAGMKNVVASSGTALTEQQVKLLKRYSNNIAVAFDMDSAGKNAGERGSKLASLSRKVSSKEYLKGFGSSQKEMLIEGMNVKVIFIPEGAGKDPDECIKKDKNVWFKAVDDRKDLMQWKFDISFQDKDITDPKEKQKIVDSLLPDIGFIPFAVERDHWLQELGSRLRVDVSVLREDLSRVKKEEHRPPEHRPVPPQERKIEAKKTRLDELSERLFMLFLRFPSLIAQYWPEISSVDLSTSGYVALYKAIKERYTTGNSIDIEVLRGDIKSDGGEHIIDVLLMKGELDFSALKESEAGEDAARLTQEIRKEYIKAHRKELALEIEQAEKAGDDDRLNALLREYQDIENA
jgi:DNA primase